jgi:hypothetical protein
MILDDFKGTKIELLPLMDSIIMDYVNLTDRFMPPTSIKHVAELKTLTNTKHEP